MGESRWGQGETGPQSEPSVSPSGEPQKKEHRQSTELWRIREDFPPSLDKLQHLVEAKVHILQSPIFEDQKGLVCEEDGARRGLWRFAVLSEELTFHLQQLQRQTEQELSNIHPQLLQIDDQRQQLNTELLNLQQKKKETEQQLKRNTDLQASAVLLRVCRDLQVSVNERLLQSERLLFQEEALSALHNLLTQDLRRYQEETQRLTSFKKKILQQSHRADEEETLRHRDYSMQERNETEPENNVHKPESFTSKPPFSLHQNTNRGEEEQAWRSNHKKPSAGLSRSSNLYRAGSIKDLIVKFSDPDFSYGSTRGTISLKEQIKRSASVEALDSQEFSKPRSTMSTSCYTGREENTVPRISVNAPIRNTIQNGPEAAQREAKTSQGTARNDCPEGGASENTDSKPRTQPTDSRDSVTDSGVGSESDLDLNRQADSPDDEPSTPRPVSTNHNPKYQLFLSNEMKSNGISSRDADSPGVGGLLGENGHRVSRWETTIGSNIGSNIGSTIGTNHLRGSMESLSSRDLDSTSDRFGAVDSPLRTFNSPYSTAISMDYNPIHRMSDFKIQGGLSPATSEMNLFNLNSNPMAPPASTLPSRSRFSAYDSLIRRRTELNNTMNVVAPPQFSMRPVPLGGPNKKDYIEELTKQMDACQKRNHFLEAESVEMEKERNQIRLEMRGLLVNNEDLLRTNSQLTNEMKRMREQMIEMDRENQSLSDRCREMEMEVKEARNFMVEANTQEYAFNFLEQSLKNKIQDAEETLEKQSQYNQTLSEKLWLAERQLEELEVDKDTYDKTTAELNNTIIRMDAELSEALQTATQATAELNLQQKLREDSQLRVDELEESLLGKEQEVQKLQVLIDKLQGEVSGKLIDKQRTLEEEIQLREKIQLQCKQAERMVDDLKMELQTTYQARDDLVKQVKQSQEKMIDLEGDVEELHDSEQRWAAKCKRAIEQTEQLQLKLIQEKDMNDLLEADKASLERQLRDLRLELEDIQSSKIQEDVISRTENKVKELENALRTEERNKAVLTNTISKLERRIHELSDQMEEEHRISNEQKDLLTQRMRSLKRQLNETEEDASRKEAQHRHTQRELAEERETNIRLQRQVLDQHLQTKRNESMKIRQTLDNLRLDLSAEDEDDQPETNISNV
ncbi:myosin-11 [Antennarius striatus]|uniref:myosin-11 n=1 Tax=Antennarius striatus TaxID=241820 RepID=UPI0035B4C3DE